MEFIPVILLIIVLLSIFNKIKKISRRGSRVISKLNRQSKTYPKEKSGSYVAKSNEPSYRWPDINGFEFEIVGESFYSSHLAALLSHVEPGDSHPCTAVLVPESNNPHDPMAVSVWIDGGVVGHLSRDDARSFRRRLSSKKLSGMTTSCAALAHRGFMRKDGSAASDSVSLDMKPFDN